jgi:4-amino-4-deoxy-L-arabinose transferase-like glycosyltransferase
MRLRRETFLVLLFAGAFLLRLATVLALRDLGQGPVGPSSADDVQFNTLALHVAAGQGYTDAAGRATSFRAPGWPLFLAGLYSLAGPQPWVVYLANCVLGALSCLLAYLLARDLLGGGATAEGPARAAGVLTALYVPHIWFATVFVSENLYVPCQALVVWLVVRLCRLEASAVLRTAAKRKTFALACVAGLLLGWAVLTRPFALLLVPLLGAVLLYAGWRAGRLRPLAALVLPSAALAVMLPWTLRNYRVHGRAVLVATNGGSTFYGGNNGRVAREWRQLGSWLSTTELPGRERIAAQPDEVAHDQEEWRLGRRWLSEHPGSVPHLLACKLARLVVWLPDSDAGGPLTYALRAAGYFPFLVLVLVGAVRGLRRGGLGAPPWLAVHATLLATVLTALVFWGSPRFRDANAPLLMLYAALAFVPARSASAGGSGRDPAGRAAVRLPVLKRAPS